MAKTYKTILHTIALWNKSLFVISLIGFNFANSYYNEKKNLVRKLNNKQAFQLNYNKIILLLQTEWCKKVTYLCKK